MRTKLSTKGQLIIPQEIRRRLGWHAGTEVEVEEREGGVLLRLPVEVPRTELGDLVGCARYEGPRRTLEEMDEAIALGARE
jgi:AbrB family looped-hinge helix DNA binding protein